MTSLYHDSGAVECGTTHTHVIPDEVTESDYGWINGKRYHRTNFYPYTDEDGNYLSTHAENHPDWVPQPNGIRHTNPWQPNEELEGKVGTIKGKKFGALNGIFDKDLSENVFDTRLMSVSNTYCMCAYRHPDWVEEEKPEIRTMNPAIMWGSNPSEYGWLHGKRYEWSKFMFDHSEALIHPEVPLSKPTTSYCVYRHPDWEWDMSEAEQPDVDDDAWLTDVDDPEDDYVDESSYVPLKVSIGEHDLERYDYLSCKPEEADMKEYMVISGLSVLFKDKATDPRAFTQKFKKSDFYPRADNVTKTFTIVECVCKYDVEKVKSETDQLADFYTDLPY